MRETKFSTDPLGNRIFDGFTQDENWNGWACPYFTFDQAQQIVQAYQENGMKAWYDGASDAFSFEIDAGEGEKEIDTFPSQEMNGKKVYPIGAFCWIWEEATEELMT